mgnify:CR=1 FL=1
MATKRERVSGFFIDHSGMGGFLNPPGHPEHTLSVIERNRRGTEIGAMTAYWPNGKPARDSLIRPGFVKSLVTSRIAMPIPA